MDSRKVINIPVEYKALFENNWREVNAGEVVAVQDFSKGVRYGGEAVQVVMGAPYERGDTLGATYLLAIDAAKNFVFLEHAYFVPNKKLRPSDKIDTAVVREASKLHWRELMAAGVKIYVFQPSMLHGKLMVVDGEFSVVGSGSCDDRTFFMNDEMNLNVWG